MGLHHDLAATNRARGRRRSGLLALLAVCALVGASIGAGAARVQADEALTALAPGQMNRTDQLGFEWDPNIQGVLRNGSNDCFDNAMALKVGGSAFKPSGPALQTKDGGEIVLRGLVGGLAVTRRIRIDLAKGAARYVEVLENQEQRSVTVQVEVRTLLGSSAEAVLTDQGRGVVNGGLQRHEVGLIAVQGRGSRPGALFQVRTRNSLVLPKVAVENNRAFVFTWDLEIPAGRTVALLHSVAQRRWNGPPAGALLAAEFEPFLEAAWASGLSRAVRAAVINHGAAGGGPPARGTAGAVADGAMRAMSAAYEVERGNDAVLFLERDMPLLGVVFGASLKIATRLGPTDVPFAEVAVLLGGARRGRSMHVYLRNGEVLAGEVAAEGLLFTTKAGLEIPLEPAGIDALFLPKGDADGEVAAGTAAFLTQLDGTQLALAESAGARLDAVTPWGSLDVPLDVVTRIETVREPAPGLWMHLRDGSLLPVVLQGEAVKLASLRFGAVAVEPGSFAAWNRADAGAAEASSEPAGTHLRLLGTCHLVGTFTAERLHVDTIAGVTPLRVEQIERMERSDDDDDVRAARPAFEITLANGETLQGRLRERLLTVRTAYGVCRTPLLHVDGYLRNDPPAPDEEDREAKGDEIDPDKVDPGKVDPGKVDPGKDGSAEEKAPAPGKDDK